MEKTFNYIQTKTFLEDIHIQDIGSCIIEGITEFNSSIYLWIKTDFGMSRIFQIGPFPQNKELNYLQKSFSFSYSKIAYKESALIKIIDNFLNKLNIIQAQEIEEKTLREKCEIDFFKFMENN